MDCNQDRAISKMPVQLLLKSAKEIKDENRKQGILAILQDKAAMTDIDKAVKDSIELLNTHISDALKKGEMDQYGNFVIGTSPRGRSVLIKDGANAIRTMLDDYQRYKDYERQAEEAKKERPDSDGGYYGREVKAYAKRITDYAKKVKDKNYAW